MTGAANSFLLRILNRHREGFVFLAARRGGIWIETAFSAEETQRGVENFLKRHSIRRYDLYFCPNAFTRDRRQARYCVDTPFALSDIDAADPLSFSPQPTILLETSPVRYQGIWEFSEALPSQEADSVSKHLTYAFGGDRGGWSCTKYLRVPFTLNHKPQYNLPLVKLLHHRAPLLDWPNAISKASTSVSTGALDPYAFDPIGVVQRYRRNMRGRYVSLMNDRRLFSPDRSRCIFMIVAALHGAGASPNEIASVVWRSPYFVDKYGEDEAALAEEVNRIIAKL